METRCREDRRLNLQEGSRTMACAPNVFRAVWTPQIMRFRQQGQADAGIYNLRYVGWHATTYSMYVYVYVYVYVYAYVYVCVCICMVMQCIVM